MTTFPRFFEAAIDPVALVLSGKWLDIYNLQHHPHEQFSAIAGALREASPAEREAVLTRANHLATFAAGVTKAVKATV